jgi:hypothetical protein
MLTNIQAPLPPASMPFRELAEVAGEIINGRPPAGSAADSDLPPAKIVTEATEEPPFRAAMPHSR